jgi:NAD(P)H-hydrate repair Nnr-like enzyme with NAD(P)H-hydrate dehydratase domain
MQNLKAVVISSFSKLSTAGPLWLWYGDHNMSSANPEFIRQTDAPLYPKVLFNRPVTRSGGGRLLIVGGHTGEFSLPTAIHQFAVAAGVGEATAVLPDALAKFLGGAPGTAFAAASTSGSLGREALGRILELSEEADAVAIGASLSNNSNTAMLIERLIVEIKRPVVIFDEALIALRHNITAVTNNPDALVILTMAEVFKLCTALNVSITIRPGGGLVNKLEIIQDLADASACAYAVYGTEIVVAAGGQLVVTPLNYRLALTPALFYGVLSTFWLQNRANPTAGLATGAYLIAHAGAGLGDTGRPSATGLAAALADTLKQSEEF